MQEKSGEAVKPKRSWRNFFITIAVIAVAVTAMIFTSPRGFDRDLDKIGAGQPALVLVYDPNLVVTSEQVSEMNQIRGELEERLQFLVADVGDAQARAFMSQYKVTPATFLIFAADGSLLKVVQERLSAEELEQQIRTALGW